MMSMVHLLWIVPVSVWFGLAMAAILATSKENK